MKNTLRLVLLVSITMNLAPGLQVFAAKPIQPPPEPPFPILPPEPIALTATPQQIDKAIEKAKAYLYAHQANGNWEIAPEFHVTPADNGLNRLEGGDWGGLTAMATHALLAADESPSDPRLKPALDLLIHRTMRMCPYALCQRDQILEMLPRTKVVKDVAFKDGDYLASCRRTKGAANGLYYYFGGNDDKYDHSVSQYGVLAMWACQQTNFEVPNDYWESTERAWQRHQDPSGGWSYLANGGPTPAMTAAGVATLFITQDYVHSGEGLFPKGNINNPAIERGMAWLINNFPSVFTPGSSQLTGAETYTLYGIERIGVAGGYKYFGTHDWYKEGATWLLQTQNGDGSWGEKRFLNNYNLNNIPVTCFALFFLTRGREPVAFNKIQYDRIVSGKREVGHWNERPRDIAKITRWIEKQTERDLNWHILNLKNTPVDELQDAPVLYISGDQDFDLAPEDEAKLRQYVENGGLILGNPDGGFDAFVKSFQKLASKLFPMYEMRVLPPEHPIYMHEQFRGDEIHAKDKLLGLSNGVRELMVMPVNDWGKFWQGDKYSQRDAFNLGDNVYVYATGRTPYRYGGPGVVHPNPALAATTTIKMARLDYAGNADPEPAGWRRIAAILHNNDKIDLQVQIVKLGAGILATVPAGAQDAQPSAADLRKAAMKRITPDELEANGGDPIKFQALVNSKIKEIQANAPAATPVENALTYKLAHLTGTANVSLTPSQRQELKAYIDSGGTLLIDAAGGSTAFADAMEKELLTIFPKEAPQITQDIADTDPHYLGDIEIRYRRYLREGDKRPSGPDLRGLKIGGRWAVLFSRQDISNGLVGRDTDGVVGYSSDCATALVTTIVKQLGK